MFQDLWGGIRTGVGNAMSETFGEIKRAGAASLGSILAGLGSKVQTIGTDIARTQAGGLEIGTRARLIGALGGNVWPLVAVFAVGTFVIWHVGKKR